MKMLYYFLLTVFTIAILTFISYYIYKRKNQKTIDNELNKIDEERFEKEFQEIPNPEDIRKEIDKELEKEIQSDILQEVKEEYKKILEEEVESIPVVVNKPTKTKKKSSTTKKSKSKKE